MLTHLVPPLVHDLKAGCRVPPQARRATLETEEDAPYAPATPAPFVGWGVALLKDDSPTHEPSPGEAQDNTLPLSSPAGVLETPVVDVTCSVRERGARADGAHPLATEPTSASPPPPRTLPESYLEKLRAERAGPYGDATPETVKPETVKQQLANVAQVRDQAAGGGLLRT